MIGEYLDRAHRASIAIISSVVVAIIWSFSPFGYSKAIPYEVGGNLLVRVSARNLSNI